VAVISVSADNDFGHPNAVVVEEIGRIAGLSTDAQFVANA
jgi:beta-lactamase superfamily II metal-dependent hydrolase